MRIIPPMQSRVRWLALYSALFVAVIVPAGITAWSWAIDAMQTTRTNRIFRLVENTVLDNYVEAKNPHELTMAALEGMFNSLDRYSVFIPADQVAAFVGTELEGTYEGIGVLLFADVAPLTVQCPLPGGPAEEAGLQVGDRIVAVDGTDLTDVPAADILDRAKDLLRGAEGTPVRLTIDRDGMDPFEVDLKRGHVPERKVRWGRLLDPEQKIAYVWIEGFQDNTDEQLGDNLDWLQAEAGGALGGLILDLRHDPGGKLDEAIAVANRFIPDGDIVDLKRRDSDVVERHAAKPERCAMADVPLVVLVDDASASASEVVTGALQDHHRAKVVGVRTFGKGLVQSIYRWTNLDFVVKLTTAYYYTPSGRCIDRSRQPDGEAGIEPDVIARLDADQVREVIGRLTSLDIPRRYRAAAEKVAKDLGQPLIEPPSPGNDPQLRAALETLRQEIADAKPEKGESTQPR